MATMALQAPMGELIPSVATFLHFQAPKHPSTKLRSSSRKLSASRRLHSEASTPDRDVASRPALPYFMTPTTISSLRAASCPSLPQMTGQTTQSILRAIPRPALRNASPISRSYSSFFLLSRSFSTTTRFGPLSLQTPRSSSIVGYTQQRSLFGNSWGGTSNRNVLAQLELTANNNSGSATAQNAFYQALLRANMPDILVERYNSGRYATNAATDNAYNRALERIGAAEAHSLGKTPAGQNTGMTSEQLQAIGQAVAAKQQGGNLAIQRSGSGAKNQPLTVVVEESLRSTIFKWVRFILLFAFSAYIALIVVTLFIDATGVAKRITGGAQNAEVKPELQKNRFSDVHGCDEAKEELQELVDFLRSPETFNTLGGKLPKGVLLAGPPGTGKTLLARAVAGEAGVPFFYMSGSEFDEVYVGVGAKRVRELFTSARAKAPAIVFIDELDAIGGKRQERDAAYVKQTLNQLLTELDGFDQNSGVIIIGATNFPQSLDKALTRPGRFDRNIVVTLPDVRGRMAILKHHMANIRVAPDVDLTIIARGTPGFSGAELESLVNQAAIRASKNKASRVEVDDMVWAKDKIMMGAERRSAVIQQKDKVMTAYHEGGHALVALLTEASMPLYKATIMPRGAALGVTHMLPEMDQVSETKRELMARIDVSMGGKVAEELIYGPENVTTGASSDIQNATSIAYHMVTRAGMSDALGNIDLSSRYQELSGETKQQIETEVRRLVEDGRSRAMDLLTKNRAGLDRLANALVEYETLNKEEIEKVVRGEKLPDKMKADKTAPVMVPDALVPSFGIPPPLPPTTDKPPGSQGAHGSDNL